MKLFSSFYRRLTSLLLILSVVPIVLLGIYLFFDETIQERKTLQIDLIIHSDDNAFQVSQQVQTRKDLIDSIGRSPTVVEKTKELIMNKNQSLNFLTRLDLMKNFNNYIVHSNWIEEVSILDKETGKAVFQSDIFDREVSFKTEPCFIEALKKIPCVSKVKASYEPLRNESGIYEENIPSFLIFSPIAGEVGIEGVLMARSTIFDLLEDEDSVMTVYANSNHYLVDSAGYFLSKPDQYDLLNDQLKKRPELELQMVTPSNEQVYIFQIRDNLGTKTTLEIYENYAGKQVVGAITSVKGTDWFYVFEIEADEAYKNIYAIQKSLFVSIGLIVSSIVGFSFLFSKSLVKPIEKLRGGISSMAKGTFREIETSSSDEFGQLSKEFNLMAKSLDETIVELGQLEKKYESLYEASPEMYRTIDAEGRILNSNAIYAKNLGYSKEEVVGKSIFDHTAQESIAAMKESFFTWKKAGLVLNNEVWLKRKDGTTFPVLISATNLYDEEGKLVGSNSVLKDMTDIFKSRKELAEAKSKRLMAIGELSARVAHDLRNPLSVIKNTVQIMKMKNQGDEKTKEHLERLERSVGRMAHQIDEVLDYVTPKTLNLQNHSIIEILNEVISRISQPDSISVDLPRNDTNITCDPEKLEIVFVNLILNAIQAMNNTGKISIRLAESTDIITIEVEDTGPGIPEDALPKIFEPLFTTRQVGTGLGLPSCKSIVERHGGTIGVKTILGKGTTFVIQLPKSPPKSERDLNDRQNN